MTIQTKVDVFHHQPPEITETGSGSALIIRDIHLISDRIETALSGTDAFG